jgi:hypothetical protein
VSSTVGSLAGNVLSIPANLAAEAGKGLLYGITQEVSKNLGGGLSTALERAASTSIGSTRLLGDKLGGQLGSMVVESFSDRLSLLTEVAEKAVEGISDQKLKKKLQETIADVKAAPQAIASQTQAAIGSEAIVQEGLYQRGQQREANKSRTPLVREQAVEEWRSAVVVSDKLAGARTERIKAQAVAATRQVASATKALSKIDSLTQDKFGLSASDFNLKAAPILQQRKRSQFDLALTQNQIGTTQASLQSDTEGLPKLEALQKRATKAGDTGLADQLANEVSNANLRVQENTKKLKALSAKQAVQNDKLAEYDASISETFGQSAEEVIRYSASLSKAQQKAIAGKQKLGGAKQQMQIANIAAQKKAQKFLQFKAVASPDQPQQYEEIARTLYGQEFDTEKLPQMVVADASLKQSGAVSQYDPLRNAIEVTTEMYEQVKAGTLTPEQITVLSEELAHARDFDFGSYQGIQAARQNRTVGETTAPTPEEFSEIAPNLGLYGEDRRALELSAKTEALRNTQAYLQRQKQGKGFSNASVFATGKDFFQNKEQS